MLIKAFVPAVVLVSALTAPVVSFAQQSNAPLTLFQLEKAGYEPAAGASPYYPARTQAAEARVSAQNAASIGYGGVGSGSLTSGTTPSVAGTKPTDSGS
jgi:hypothetical protein